MHPLRWSTLSVFPWRSPYDFPQRASRVQFHTWQHIHQKALTYSNESDGSGAVCAPSTAQTCSIRSFLSVWKNPVRYIMPFLTLCVGFWAAFVFPRVNSPVSAVSSFSFGVLPAFWPQRAFTEGLIGDSAHSVAGWHISGLPSSAKSSWFSPLGWLLHSLAFFSDAERCSKAFLVHGCIFMGGDRFVLIPWCSPYDFSSEWMIWQLSRFRFGILMVSWHRKVAEGSVIAIGWVMLPRFCLRTPY